MTRRQFLATSTAAATASAQSAKPNILFILADDLGYGNLGCYGQKQIRTPNIDRLAADGMRFTQAYAGSTVCAPSRCALMTGLHTGHARTRGNQYPDLPLRPQDLTVTELLKKAGYRTGLFGKWSLGQLGSTGYPARKGFDEWFGFFSQTHAHNFYPEHLLDGESAYLCRGNFGAKKTEYAPDLFTERAVKFIEKADARPFFLKLAYTSPHANNELGRDTGNGMEVPSTDAYADKNWPAPDKGFAAMVSRLDSDVGKVLDALERSGKASNTLVIFTSDNGPHREGGHDPDFFDDNGPLRGIKRDLYEGGIRVPFLARWKGAQGPGRIAAGSTSDHVLAFWDFMATAAELAGVSAPAGDGISFAPTLLGRGTQRQHSHLYWEFHERVFHQAVRQGNWKAVRLGPGKPVQLYDLASDLGESRDVASANADVARKLAALMDASRTQSEVWPVRARP